MSAFRTVNAATVLLVALGGVALFAPASIGGRATYARTSGESMSPGFETGDLVVLRRGSLQVGDVGGYRDPATGEVVVHRVVREAGGRLAFKGDNNWWVDSYEPTQSEVVGKLWIHIGGAGATIESASGLIRRYGIGVLGLTLVGAEAAAHSKRRTPTPRKLRFAGDSWQLVLVGLVAVGLGSTVLAAVAFGHDTTESMTETLRGRHTGAFTYEGNARPSPVYEGDVVRTGQPIFVQLVPRVTASFVYDLDASGAQDVRGTIRLFSDTRDINGWERTFELVPTTDFTGTHASVSTNVELGPLMELASALQTATGTKSQYLTTAITAEVIVSGTLSGQPFTSSFTPFYTLRITPPNEVFVETSLTRDFESVPPVTSLRLGSSFMPIQELSVPIQQSVPASMDLIFSEARVDRVRSVTLWLAIGSWFGAGLAGAAFARALRSPAAYVHVRYGNRLVHIAGLALTDGPSVEVESVEDLVRLAERYQSAILWSGESEGELFVVLQGGVSFVHRRAA